MNRIREIRKAKGLTLERLADLAGLTIPHLSRMERGKRPLTDVWMRRIGAALAVEPQSLMPTTKLGPFAGELVEDPDELALVRWWRSLDIGQKRMVVKMMAPPTASARNDAA